MRILLDCDGVFIDYHTPYVALVNHLYGTRFRPEDVTEWEIEHSLGLSADQTEAIRLRLIQPGYAQTLRPFPCALDAIRRLQAEHEVYFVTSPMRGSRSEYLTWTHDREHWLFDNLGVSKHRIVHTSAKHLCVGDVFIDDKPSNVSMWQEHHPAGFGLLWYQPYNWEHRGDLMVCHGWEHLTDLLRLLSPQYDGTAPTAAPGAP